MAHIPTDHVRREDPSDPFASDWAICLALTIAFVLAVVAGFVVGPGAIDALSG
jgi:hypothetical protein